MTNESSLNRRALLGAGMAILVTVLLLVQLGIGRRGADRAIGVVSEDLTEGVVVIDVEPDQPAERAGLRPGDRIESINGRPIDSWYEHDEAARDFRRETPQTYLVDRQGTTMELRVVPGVAFDWLAWTANAVATAFYLALGLLVLLQPTQDVRTRLASILFLAVAVELALPSDAAGMPLETALVEGPFWILTGLQFSVELHLASVIPRARRWFRGRRTPLVLYYVIGLGGGIYLATTWLPGAESNPLLAWPWTETGLVFMSAWFMLWVVGIVVILAHGALTWTEATGRNQVLLVLLGVVPWSMLMTAVIWWDLKGVAYPDWVELGQPLVLALYPVAVFFAITRYRLFSVDLVVRRSLVYAGVLGILILAFYAILGAGGALLSVLLEGSAPQIVLVAGATLALGLVFGPLRQLMENLVERRFFPERAHLRERLGSLVRTLPGRGDLQAMSKALVVGVAEIFAARSVVLLLAERDSDLLVSRASHGAPEGAKALMTSRVDPFVELLSARRRCLPENRWPPGLQMAAWLRDLGVALAVPLMRDDELTGVLLVGRKKSTQDYRAEEMELLDLLSTHVATVLENAYLFESATIDTMTGLLRREAILAELQRELDRAVRYGRPLTIAMVDIDRFKQVNDRHGHLTGDMMLRSVAAVVSGRLRSTDVAGRYGGEEFLLLLPESDLKGGLALVEKLRQAIEELSVETDEEESLSVTISAGVASVSQFTPDADLTPRKLIAAADRSLYDAKEGGRNRIASMGEISKVG